MRLPREPRSPVRDALRRLLFALGLLALVTLVVWLGRDGYRDSTDDGTVDLLDAVYYSTVSLSTTGYGDVVPVSDTARLVNVLVVTPLRVLFLIVLVGTTLEVLTKRTREQFRQARWRSSLHEHTVVVGYGTKGRSAVRALVEAGLDPARVVVVEPGGAGVADATSDGLAVVQGDGTRTEVLQRAHVADAVTVVVAVPRDDTAVLVTLTARTENRTATLVAAVREEENAPLLRASGADQVVVSSEAAGRLLGVAASSPETGKVLADLLEPGTGLELATRHVRDEEVGMSCRDLQESVLAVQRDGRTHPFTSASAEVLQAGDVVVLVRDAG